MLTLTRKVGQRILIGDDIEVVVREVRGRQVRIGIVAPAAVEVFREEVAPPSRPAKDATESDATESDATESDAAEDTDAASDPPSDPHANPQPAGRGRRRRVVDDG